jgi:hypothetical protein
VVEKYIKLKKLANGIYGLDLDNHQVLEDLMKKRVHKKMVNVCAARLG